MADKGGPGGLQSKCYIARIQTCRTQQVKVKVEKNTTHELLKRDFLPEDALHGPVLALFEESDDLLKHLMSFEI